MSASRRSLAIVTLATLGAASPPRTADVRLIAPYEVVASTDVPTRIGPERPEADRRYFQTLSLYGRENLIAPTSRDFAATACAARGGPADVAAEIVRRARATRVVLINESHERSEHRGFTTALLAPLRRAGYSGLALEALVNPVLDTPADQRPPFLRTPDLPYFDRFDGHYLQEAGFGRMGRAAKRLGYTLVAYEEPFDPRVPFTDDIATREEAQAEALAAWLRAHPRAKLIVHVGYNHAREVPRANGERWMATRLRAKTGIDPLTISQTTCRGGGPARRFAMLPADEPAGSFDLLVDHPAAHFERGRPAWRRAAGDRAVTIPAALRPTSGWRVIEARRVDDPVSAVPMDRVAIRPGEDVALMLPPGDYRLRVLTPATAR